MKKILFLLLCLVVVSCARKEVQEVQTALVKSGVFTEEISEVGEIKALNSTVVSVPRNTGQYNFKIVYIIRDGTEVEKGDTLVLFDVADTKNLVANFEQQLESGQADLERLIATQKTEIEEAESDLESQRLGYEIAKLQSEMTSYDAEINKLEKGLSRKATELSLERARMQIENRRKIQKEDLYQRNVSVSQIETRLNNARDLLNKLYLLSPSPGIAIVRQGRAVGDQIYQGNAIIDLPDLSVMTAIVNVSEVDVSKVKVGQKVVIRPDAYSDTTFSGVVMTIANLAQNKDNQSGIKVFPVVVRINGRNKNLLPGLTVNCKIVINEQPNVLYIPLESLFKDEVGEYAFVKDRSGFKRREVKTGAANADFALVLEGLEEGDELALSDPFLNKEEAGKEGAANGKNDASSTK